MGRWEFREDAKNLTLIGMAAMVGVLATGGIMVARSISTRGYVPAPRPAPAVMASYRFEATAPLSGSDRLYGRALTVDGRELEGFIRWDRNEGSWTDVLDADKVAGGRETQAGIRFGQIQRIRVEGSSHALLTLRSGEQVEMSARATDLGRGLRAFIISDADHGQSELSWDDLDVVEFLPVPDGDRPAEARLYGTLTTRSGESFTGRIAWDVDEIYTTDILDGDRDGRRMKIPFGAIGRIEREGSRAARVVLTSGEALTLSGTNDVNDSNGGISVSDPSLGQVKVSWDDFADVTFTEAPPHADQVLFDGGRPIAGTVTTESGESLTGTLRWDNDEASTWEMLNGEYRGIEFEIEFAQIARIEKNRRGTLVTLRDGRTFELSGSNDVDDGNRGIVVETGNAVHKVRWEDFRELRLDS
jgi:hypothetical protein